MADTASATIERREFKYLVHPSRIPAIRRALQGWCVLDRHAQSNRLYAIRSLYLDTPDLRLAKANADAQKMIDEARASAQALADFCGARRQVFGDVIQDLRAGMAGGSGPAFGGMGSLDRVADVLAVADADMAEEMRTHLELQTAQNISRGMAPEEARYAARRSFGGALATDDEGAGGRIARIGHLDIDISPARLERGDAAGARALLADRIDGEFLLGQRQGFDESLYARVATHPRVAVRVDAGQCRLHGRGLVRRRKAKVQVQPEVASVC